MTNRREILQTCVSVSALPLVQGLLSPHALAGIEGNGMRLYKAIFDDRYAEARSFAEAVDRLGVPVHALENGDVTDLWYDEPDLFRPKPPPAIAGITQFGPMFVFEQLGREHRMRTVLRVEHQARRDGTIAHVMTGSRETLALAEQLRLRHPDWPVVMAALLTHCRADGTAAVERTIVMPDAKPMPVQSPAPSGSSARESVIHYYVPDAIRQGHGVPWDGPLFSWVIARVVGGRSPFTGSVTV